MGKNNHRWELSVGLFVFFMLMPVLAEEIPLDSGELQKYADVALLEERLDAFEEKLNVNLLNIIELNKQTLSSVQSEMQELDSLRNEVVTMKILFLTLGIAQVCLSFAISTYLLNKRIGKLTKQWEGLIMWVINKLETEPKTFDEFVKSLPEETLWNKKAYDKKQDFKLVPEEKKPELPKVKPKLDEEMPFADLSEAEKRRIEEKFSSLKRQEPESLDLEEDSGDKLTQDVKSEIVQVEDTLPEDEPPVLKEKEVVKKVKKKRGRKKKVIESGVLEKEIPEKPVSLKDKLLALKEKVSKPKKIVGNAKEVMRSFTELDKPKKKRGGK